jgi:hypothetical protein
MAPSMPESVSHYPPSPFFLAFLLLLLLYLLHKMQACTAHYDEPVPFFTVPTAPSEMHCATSGATKTTGQGLMVVLVPPTARPGLRKVDLTRERHYWPPSQGLGTCDQENRCAPTDRSGQGNAFLGVLGLSPLMSDRLRLIAPCEIRGFKRPKRQKTGGLTSEPRVAYRLACSRCGSNHRNHLGVRSLTRSLAAAMWVSPRHRHPERDADTRGRPRPHEL